MVNIVNKGWGREIIFANTSYYCGKLLQFDREGSKCSMHFHSIKDETWYVTKGSFKVSIIQTSHANSQEYIIAKGDVWHNPPLVPHQLIALEEDSEIYEVSTYDNPDDNYKIFPGDSQT